MCKEEIQISNARPEIYPHGLTQLPSILPRRNHSRPSRCPWACYEAHDGWPPTPKRPTFLSRPSLVGPSAMPYLQTGHASNTGGVVWAMQGNIVESIIYLLDERALYVQMRAKQSHARQSKVEQGLACSQGDSRAERIKTRRHTPKPCREMVGQSKANSIDHPHRRIPSSPNKPPRP